MRIAASTYLNSAPLVYSFATGSQRGRAAFLGDTAPARCAEKLAAGQCEVALIPVIEYQRIPHLRIIPDVAVVSKKRVRSVVLAARCPIEEARAVTLDNSSRTSQALVRILFARRYGATPVFTERAPDPAVSCANMFEGSDAALVIGDPAMRLEARAAQLGLRIYDLAEEWRALTGLPFVFAVWAAREGAVPDEPGSAPDFLAAKREGIAHDEEIAARYAAELDLPQAELLGYLRENVNYDLDEDNLAGLRHYFRLARECGLIAAERELRFSDQWSAASIR
jgi:chorismate dehydratase